MLEALERIYAECKRGTQVDPETARVTPRKNAGECLINVLDIAGEAMREPEKPAPKYAPMGQGKWLHPVNQSVVHTEVIEQRDWGRVLEIMAFDGGELDADLYDFVLNCMNSYATHGKDQAFRCAEGDLLGRALQALQYISDQAGIDPASPSGKLIADVLARIP
jgi:hypothetical protein